ncbi:ectonucleoside triphosphate diphosphohydrolase 2-like [Limulus polyphemus]|uniref:Ectonucleoside triphosphate diphosphohydrolase 2-like n=1 Tax=Limulus polyphemus TaxID=6850 RepID=A0ABM1SPR2_LIMPO|nr:ectonucleoside triphosphate diphosphohydrolase 2-like [Limulus polyphemus]XP_022245617.1 ectonucleoside triphosphate diphosphohydrolase 2-like [Limulus polyphemus]XP_022245618.1 ectonucleoside triphosphate diphosphohydrolase 2-like [Limulus polyphemus]
MVVGGSGLLTVSLLYSLTGGEIPFDYGVVFDAGSTHTQITVYKWEGDKYQGTGEVKQITSCKVEGGVASETDPKEAGPSLMPCLSNVSQFIPTKKLAGTPLYVGATAGMRLLNLSNTLLAEAILLLTRCTLVQSDFSVKTVEIISGHDEGVFAWITANFFLRRFVTQPSYEEVSLEEDSYLSTTTVGTLDLGGASTQIAFELSKGDSENRSVSALKLYGHNYRVFSKSYLCFGINEALRRFYFLLVKDPLKITTIDNPCGPKGHNQTYSGMYLFDQPCTWTERSAELVRLNPSILNENYTFVGQNNNTECAITVSKLFDVKSCKNTFKECLEAPEKPLPMAQFIAFSDFFYTLNFFNATNGTLEDFKQNIDRFCEKPWKEVKDLNSSYLELYCFEGHFVHYILTTSYGFTSTTWSNIIFKKQVGKMDLGWSLGYMTNTTNALPAEKPTLPILALPVFVTLLLLTFIILVISGFFGFYFSTINVSKILSLYVYYKMVFFLGC